MGAVTLRPRRAFVLLAAAAAPAFLTLWLIGRSHAQSAAEVERIAAIIGLRPGMTIADIGAGTGTLTVALARLVGPSGRVYSTEIDRDRLDDLRAAADDAGLRHVVTIVEGHASRTNLPEACCDVLVLRNVYHHFREPAAMAASLFASLRPGGRLLVIDFSPRRMSSGPNERDRSRARSAPPPDRGGTSGEPAGRVDRARGGAHGVAPETVAEELRAAGFEILEHLDDWPGRRAFAVLARRPASPP